MSDQCAAELEETMEQILERAETLMASVRFCFYCGRKDDRMQLDHVVPVSRGGINGPLVPACPSCNCLKNDSTLEEFRRRCGGGKFPGEGFGRIEYEEPKNVIRWMSRGL